jgi:hypothetical protein
MYQNNQHHKSKHTLNNQPSFMFVDGAICIQFGPEYPLHANDNFVWWSVN